MTKANLPERFASGLLDRWLGAKVAMLIAFSLLCGAAWGQAFPSKPVLIIVTAVPGGSSDILARRLAKIIQAQSGANVVVDNRGGASGSIGVLATIRAPADGYTVTLVVPDSVTVYPLLKKVRPYNAETDLTPIAQIAETHFVFAVSAKNPANNLAEFASYIKSKPGGKASYGSPGNGTTSRLVTEMLKQRIGIDGMQHVPYRSTAPALAGVVSGEIEMVATSVASIKGLVDSGHLKSIGIARESRLPGFETIPTAAEAGISNFIVPVWWGLFAPPRLPKDISESLSALFVNAIASDEFKQQAIALGLTARPRSGADFGNFVKADTLMWQDAIQRAGIPLED